ESESVDLGEDLLNSSIELPICFGQVALEGGPHRLSQAIATLDHSGLPTFHLIGDGVRIELIDQTQECVKSLLDERLEILLCIPSHRKLDIGMSQEVIQVHRGTQYGVRSFVA